MLTIDIKVNGRLIGHADVSNISELSNTSDYAYRSESASSPVTGKGQIRSIGTIRHHNRVQSAWALVAEVARSIAQYENNQ